MKILLSIKPIFADLIFSGEKCYEYRKSVYRNQSVKTVIVYATRPVAKIIGEFDVSGIVAGEPSDLWDRTQERSGISKEFFELYFEGRKSAFAIEIGAVRRYEKPIDPDSIFENFTAPQSYMYIDGIPGRSDFAVA